MSTFDDASLVFIPSGYKTSKAYSVKPIDGSGDLTFTRSNDTATRVNSAGLIEKVRTNLVLQSNTFNTTWTGVAASVTSGQAGYDGTNNAWLLSKSSGYGRVEQTLATTGLETFSVYVKAGDSNYTEITSNAGPYVAVNLTNGSIVAQSGVTAVVASVGSGWYRISIAYTKAASNVWRIIAGDAGSSSSAAGSSGTIIIQAAQAETGDIATPYIPTTSAAVSVGPVANVPRLDYLNSSCPRLLLEPQRTNLVRYSEQFNNAAWAKEQATATANTTTSPDGYVNADSFIDNSTNSRHIFYKSLSGDFSTQRTFSVFAKQNTLRYLALSVAIAGDAHCYSAIFDLASGTVSATKTNGNGTLTASIESYSNGWYRCIISGTMTTGSGSFFPLIGSSNRAGFTGSLFVNNMPIYSGSGQSLYLWGAQLEAGAYATSYIPTLGAAVTRGADAASKTGISSLIGQAEGTLFVDVNITKLVNSESIGTINSGGYANNITINRVNATIQFTRNSATQSGPSVVTSSAITTGRHKMAIAYKSGDTAFFLDGVQVSTTQTQTFTNGTLSVLAITGDAIGAILFSDSYNQALLFKTRLTNAQLAELTTL